jgi:hypothetical protein
VGGPQQIQRLDIELRLIRGRARAMFEGLEHQATTEEKKLLTVEVIASIIACAVLGGAAFWFFSYFGEY